MKFTVCIIALSITVSLANAQLVVTDPIAHSLTRIDHAQDIGKYVQMINNQVTQINTLTNQLHQIEAYVKAFGNPAQLLNIVGANQLVGSLQQSGVGTTLTQLQRSANGLQALQYNGNGLYLSLGGTFTTPDGNTISRAQDTYRKYGAVQDDSRNFQHVTDDVLARRKKLRHDIAATTQKLQASTTDAETQKLHGVLTGYNAELATVDHEIDNAAAEVVAQDAENRADRERQEQARREERQAQMEESVRQYGEVFRLETTPPSFPNSR
jgi:septal ring factor EnvC (AmiA/AmiB activator)